MFLLRIFSQVMILALASALVVGCGNGFRGSHLEAPVSALGGGIGSGDGAVGGGDEISPTPDPGDSSPADPSPSQSSPSPNSTRIFSPGGGINLAQVQIMGSPDVRSWSRVSSADGSSIRLTDLSFRPGVFHIDYSARGLWPSVDIGDGVLQEATVWIFYYIDGQWYGTGGERLRPGQTDKELGNPSSVGEDWLYDGNRWGPMAHYIPAPGEMVGFMVTQGSLRSDSNYTRAERSNIVLVPFPADGVDSHFPPFAWEEL
jgi:hypothetical protein